MDKAQILKEIKEHYKFKSDAEFARFLGITPQNLKHWLTRNTFDISILATKCVDLNTDWLITGEGEMIKKAASIEEPRTDDADYISMPREVWKVIEDQAASLRAKDESLKLKDESLKIKDQQVSEVIALLKEQIKKGEDVAGSSHVAPMAAQG